VFIAGMFVVVRAIEDTGLTTLFGHWLMYLSSGTILGAVLVGAAGSALGTNLVNNVPMAAIMTAALGSVEGAPLRDPARLRRVDHTWLQPGSEPDHSRIAGDCSLAAYPPSAKH